MGDSGEDIGTKRSDERPDGETTGESAPRNAAARSTDGMTGAVEIDDIEQRYAADLGPSPVDLFLGSLAACLSLSIRYQAEMRDAPVGGIEVETDAEPASGSVESIGIAVRLDAPAVDDETLARIVEYGERSCHVAELLREDLPVEVTWERVARETDSSGSPSSRR